jgi:hypothetical protein
MNILERITVEAIVRIFGGILLSGALDSLVKSRPKFGWFSGPVHARPS